MSQPTVLQQIEEIKAKITLIEGDQKAYLESSEWTRKQNKEMIAKKRSELKSLYKTIAEQKAADQDVINKAFVDRPKERMAYKNKTGLTAVEKMDEKVSDKLKQLDSMRNRTVTLQKKLETKRTEYNQKVKDASDAVATDAGESPEAQRLRDLENRLDKSNLKCKEAEHIRKTYLEIKSKLEGEHKGFDNTINNMEMEIRRCQEELRELKTMRDDAEIAKNVAKSELEKKERKVYADRKQREIELQEMKKIAEEKQAYHDRVERRMQQRNSLTGDDQAAQQINLGSEEEQQKITSYEQAFKVIKEATSVHDTQEVVKRFENQGETQQHLEELKKQNQKEIGRLRERKEKLDEEFEEKKYTGEKKLSDGERMLERYEEILEKEEHRRILSKEKLERSSKTLVESKSGVNHLSEKLKSLKASKSNVQKAKVSPQSDEYVLEQLSVCEEKLLKLLQELENVDLDETQRRMEEEEFNSREFGLPRYNQRVKFPLEQSKTMFDEDENSGEDDQDAMTREKIKEESEQMRDSKKRRGKKKKKF
ncbi:unnamed protein product [Dimorphilus gyrociliatus]|uniref:ODAD1 central coiled coil region domain-containing protein n=1 Tax=Dimorphilus gyrociliatus TaxID=2664684 RepID=A0A7I8VPM9_9ANNE|nr:unnamed protein product [Dimorphilus gyrociliatus]